jgi:hypothetical protein
MRTWAQLGPNVFRGSARRSGGLTNRDRAATAATAVGDAPPTWGSRGREFKSRQPDGAKCLVKRQIHLSKYLPFMIVFGVDHLF